MIQLDESSLALDKIRIDGGTQPRCEIKESLVAEYAENMKDGVEFPAVVVFFDGANNWLADGFHRYHAARRAGLDALPADIRPGSLRDAILYSVGANAAHGQRRSIKDKRKAVMTLLEDEEWGKWSGSEVARRCKVHHSMVNRIKVKLSLALCASEPRTYTDKHGNVSTMNTENIGKKKGKTAKEKPTGALKKLPPKGNAGDVLAKVDDMLCGVRIALTSIDICEAATRPDCNELTANIK